ncbi:MAG: hypothetical protein ACRDZ4_04070 [Egibacteraceae bacterium]
MERFADRLMDALVSEESVIDADGWSQGPALLFKAVQEAGMPPLHEWTDVPGARNYGRVDPAAVLRRLVSRERLLRSVRAELLPA